MKLLLINCTHEHSSFNHDKGSEAYFSCALEILRRFFPDAEFISKIKFPSPMALKFKILPMANSKLSNRTFSLWSSLDSTVDLFLVACMCFFSKIFRQQAFINSKNPIIRWRSKLRMYSEANMVVHLGLDHFSNNAGFITVFEHCKEIIISSLMGKPIALFAQSPGPFQGKLTSLIARKAINNADIVILREEVSLEKLKEAKISGNIKITADPAFLLSSASTGQVKEILLHEGIDNHNIKNNGIIGLIVSGYNTLSLDTKKSWFFVFLEKLYSILLFIIPEILLDKYLKISRKIFRSLGDASSISCSQEVINLIDFLTSELNVNVFLIPHSKGGNILNDVAILESYWQGVKYKDKVKVIKGDYNPSETKGIIGNCDMIISTKMHACIAALSQGIPTVAIAWSHKYYGVMKMLEQEDCICSSMVEQEIIPVVREAWRQRSNIKNELLKKMPKVKSKAQLTGKLISQLQKL